LAGTVHNLALLGNFTLDFLAKELSTQLEQSGFAVNLHIGGYSQYQQELLDQESGFYAFSPGVAVIILDPRPFLLQARAALAAGEDVAELGARKAGEMLALVGTALDRLPSMTVLFATFYLPRGVTMPGLELNTGYGLNAFIAAFNGALARESTHNPRLKLVDMEGLIRWQGEATLFDQRLWAVGRIRFSRAGDHAMARWIGSAVRSLWGGIRKVLVLDLDDTLWGGVLGELGPSGIALGEEGLGLAYKEFQQQLAGLTDYGAILALCSKNNEEEVEEVFRTHPHMILDLKDFAARMVNWRDKATNIKEISRRLNLGLESFVFIDDNPAERALIRQKLPMVAVPEFPRDPSSLSIFLWEVVLDHFNRLGLTEEDRAKGEQYRVRGMTEELRESANDLESFWASLEMRGWVGLMEDCDRARVAQLTQKTNQFNLTTERFDEAALQKMLADKGWKIYYLKLADKFGNHGLVGVIIAGIDDDDPELWTLKTFLLSCRVIGRKAEDFFLALVADHLRSLGARRLRGIYVPSARNSQVADLYPRMGFDPVEGSQNAWEMDLERRPLRPPSFITVEQRPRTD